MSENRRIFEVENNTVGMLASAGLKQDGFLSDKNYAHAYKAGDGFTRAVEMDYVLDPSGSIAQYLDKKFGATEVASIKVNNLGVGNVVSDVDGILSVEPSVSVHNNLTGIQGGTPTERYHLSQSEYQNLAVQRWDTDGTTLTTTNSEKALRLGDSSLTLDINDSYLRFLDGTNKAEFQIANLELINDTGYFKVDINQHQINLGEFANGNYGKINYDVVNEKLTATDKNGTYDLYQPSLGEEASWLNPVINFFDPTSALPATPTDEDRYISSATANGWVEHYVYEWSDSGSEWVETVVNEEGVFVYIQDLDGVYYFTGVIWTQFSSGSLIWKTDGSILSLVGSETTINAGTPYTDDSFQIDKDQVTGGNINNPDNFYLGRSGISAGNGVDYLQIHLGNNTIEFSKVGGNSGLLQFNEVNDEWKATDKNGEYPLYTGDALKKDDGFENPTDITLTTGTTTSIGWCTIRSVNEIVYWVDGSRYTMTANTDHTINIPDVEGWVWVFADATGLVTRANYVSGESSVLLAYWNADDKDLFAPIPQLHGVMMPSATHEYLHFTRGSVVKDGYDELRIFDFTTGGDGSTDAEYQFKVKSGTYYDEDIEFDIAANNTSFAPVVYKLGGGLSPEKFRLQIETTTDSFLYNAPSGRPYYNAVDSNGDYSLVEVPTGKFIAVVVMASPTSVPQVALLPQDIYDTVEEVRLNAASEFHRLKFEQNVLRELAPLGIVIYKVDDSFTNSRKAKIIEYSSLADGLEQPYYDLRCPSAMVDLPTKQTLTPDVTFIEAWNWIRYSCYYGGMANTNTTDPATWDVGDTFYIHRNAANGNNMSVNLDAIAADSTLYFENDTREASVTLVMDGAFTYDAPTQIYSCTILSVTTDGDFYESDLIDFGYQTGVSSASWVVNGAGKLTPIDETKPVLIDNTLEVTDDLVLPASANILAGSTNLITKSSLLYSIGDGVNSEGLAFARPSAITQSHSYAGVQIGQGCNLIAHKSSNTVFFANNLYYDSVWKAMSSGYGAYIGFDSLGSVVIRNSSNSASASGDPMTLPSVDTFAFKKDGSAHIGGSLFQKTQASFLTDVADYGQTIVKTDDNLYFRGHGEDEKILSALVKTTNGVSLAGTFDVSNTVASSWCATFINSSAGGYGVYIKSASEASGAFRVDTHAGAKSLEVNGYGEVSFPEAYSDTVTSAKPLSINSTGKIGVSDVQTLANRTGDPTTPTSSANIYAKSGEMYVQDTSNNVTQISPHNDEGEWEYYSKNTKTGKEVKINMEKMIRFLEQFHSETFIEEVYNG